MQGTLNVIVGQSPAELAGPEARLDWLKTVLGKLQGQDIDLIVLPELFLSGYNIGAELNERAETKDGPLSRRIAGMARAHDLAIHYGFAERDGEALYNAAACYGPDGCLISLYRKLLLPPGFEGTRFSAGNGGAMFRLGAFRIATLICYDAEFPENFRAAACAGADLVLVPTALSAEWGVVAEKLIPTRAFENGVFVCYANHCGEENGLHYHGGSCIVSPNGQDLTRAGADETCLHARLELSEVRAAQARLPYLRDRLKLPRD